MIAGKLAAPTIYEASELIKASQISPVELVEASLARIRILAPKLNAFITVVADEAHRAAKDAETEIAAGRYRGPLHGIPIALKDNIVTKGVRTTAASKVLADWVPDYDSTVAVRLWRAGAVLVGKTNLHEFAGAILDTDSHFGPCRNPWDPQHVPGGSSSGSAAVVATGMCPGALGTDTTGSIRGPASYTGVVGMKPTYGLIGRYGVIPISWSLDHAGPMTRTVRDCALMLGALAGHDSRDPGSAQVPRKDYTSLLGQSLEGVTIGIPDKSFFFHSATEEVEGLVHNALGVLEELGARVVEVSLPHVEYSESVATVITGSEGASVHERWLRSCPQGYSPYLRDRFRIAALIPAIEYQRAQRVRALIRHGVEQAFKRVDVLVTPTTPFPAPRIGQKSITIRGREESLLSPTVGIMTRPFSLAGVPVVSVPCGFSGSGLPVGMSIIGPHFGEQKVLQVAYAHEQVAGWHRKEPQLSETTRG